jgi:hypothetical protein
MKAITIEYLNEPREAVALNIAAEPGHGAVVRISRAGPAPGDDPKERIAEEAAIRVGISAIGWCRSHSSQVAATELREGRYSLVAPNPPAPRSPTPYAPAWRRPAWQSARLRCRDG